MLKLIFIQGDLYVFFLMSVYKKKPCVLSRRKLKRVRACAQTPTTSSPGGGTFNGAAGKTEAPLRSLGTSLAGESCL